MDMVTTRKTLAEVTREVADEWTAAGKPLALPPDTDDEEREQEFWDEVQRRFDEQVTS